MRIGFDARMVDHPGVGRYIKCLLPEIIKQDSKDEFVIFGDSDLLKGIDAAENTSVVSWKAPIYSPQEQFFLPYSGQHLDILHVPHFNVPLLFKGKMVVTIHDLIYLLFPSSVPSPVAKHYASFMIGAALKKADKTIAVSDHTRKDLIKVFGQKYSSGISVVHEAAGSDFRVTEDKEKALNIRDKYDLSERIILYVGSVKPHKNVATLIKVFGLLKEWGIPHQLVVCGKWDKKEDHLRRELEGNDIRYLEKVPTDDLVVLYNIADCLVHLSLYEGFGLTVLEAMQCGTPVVMSDTSSLPEVAGNAALTVSPLNVEQIANTVYNVLVNKQLKEGMIETGFERAGQFSWKKTAQKTLELYNDIT